MNRRELIARGAGALSVVPAVSPGMLPTELLPPGDPQSQAAARRCLRRLRELAATHTPETPSPGYRSAPATPLPPLGQRDLGQRDLGQRDLGQRDLGQRDLGQRPTALVEGQATAIPLTAAAECEGLQFLCSAGQCNVLAVAGQPLVAKRFCFSVTDIRWRPAPGGPIYEQFAPRFDSGTQSTYPSAKLHQIVPLILGGAYFSGCQSADYCLHTTAGPLAFDVNLEPGSLSAGQYTVTLWSLA
jgi:hypothetical protein